MTEILRASAPNVNAEAVRIVERLLDDLRAGRVTTVAVIAVSPLGQVNDFASGMQGEPIYIGCDILKSKIIAGMVSGANRIVRA